MNPKFGLERKGYNRYEVDRFILQINQELELLRARLADCERRLKEQDEALAQARKDRQYIGDTMIQAELAARDIVEEAEERARERENRRRAEEETQIRLLNEKKQELEEMRKRMAYLLRSQLALLEIE